MFAFGERRLGLALQGRAAPQAGVRRRMRPGWWRHGPATGGLATYGTGYEQARARWEGGDAHPDQWISALAKLATTLLSTVSGIPGGIFSPLLAVGAGLGHHVSWLFPRRSLGRRGDFLGHGRLLHGRGAGADPRGWVIILEMSEGSRMVVPLMATALLATGASRLVCPHPLYHVFVAELRTSGESRLCWRLRRVVAPKTLDARGLPEARRPDALSMVLAVTLADQTQHRIDGD